MADIQPGGTFSPGRVKDGDGIPSGVYKISVRGAISKEALANPGPPKVREPGEQAPGALIHLKYENADTSGLTIDTTKTKTLDLVLDPPE